MKSYAWTWTIKPECLDDYVKLHKNPWPEMIGELRASGLHIMDIFQFGNRFFYYAQSEDMDAAFEYQSKSEVCKRWNAITSAMVEGSFDFSEEEPVAYLDRSFTLD